MGTSSSYGGQKDKKGLLPEDYDDNNEVVPPSSWKGTKTEFSKHINGNGGSGTKKTVGNFVRASGGANRLIHSSSSGIRGAVNIGTLFSKVASQGFSKTFNELGIKYRDKSVEEICSSLVNYIAKDSNTKDDAIAREAATNALVEIYSYMDENQMTFETQDTIPDALMDCVFCKYVENYIWGKILNDLEICLEKHANDINKILQIENEMKLYVSNTVSTAFNSEKMRDKVFGKQPAEAGVQELYLRCYKELEEY